MTERTRGVIPVHFAGVPWTRSARRVRAAPTTLPSSRTRPTRSRRPSPARRSARGGRGDLFSFYATKTLTTGEGGMITTDDDDVADRCGS